MKILGQGLNQKVSGVQGSGFEGKELKVRRRGVLIQDLYAAESPPIDSLHPLLPPCRGGGLPPLCGPSQPLGVEGLRVRVRNQK